MQKEGFAQQKTLQAGRMGQRKMSWDLPTATETKHKSHGRGRKARMAYCNQGLDMATLQPTTNDSTM